MEKIFKEKKKLIFCIIACALIMCLVITVIVLISSNNKNEVDYERYLTSYGLYSIYEDVFETKKTLTKSEAIKLIVSASLNTTEIERKIIGLELKDTYSNAKWVAYANSYNALENVAINASNESEEITFIDFITLLSNVKEKVLRKEVLTSDVVLEDVDKYTDAQISALKDMIASGIIDENYYIKNATKSINKDKVQEILCKYYEKFSGVIPEGDEVQKDEKEYPSNASDYPYILKNVDKNIYEIGITDLQSGNKPIDLFEKLSPMYSSIVNKIEDYYNKILNVDYETITNEYMDEMMENVFISEDVKASISKYVNYVKQNKIKLKGNAKVQMPIVYYDGYAYRVRTKMEFEVLSSDTDIDLLFYCGSNMKYTGKTFVVYTDIEMVSNSKGIYIYNVNMLDNMIDVESYNAIKSTVVWEEE